MGRHSYVYPFFQPPGLPHGPYLPIQFLNPLDGISFEWYCMVDTGAAESLFSADLAEVTGHDLIGDGVKKDFRIGVEGKRVPVWLHTFVLKVIHPSKPNRVIWESDQSLFACCAHQKFPQLLGVHDFLCHFRATFDYPGERMILSWEN